jgi:hypothetical protein
VSALSYVWNIRDRTGADFRWLPKTLYPVRQIYCGKGWRPYTKERAYQFGR